MNKLILALITVIVIGGGLYAANVVTSRTDPTPKETEEATATPSTETKDGDTTKAQSKALVASDAETGVAASGHERISPVQYGNGGIIIREYASFTCSHCASFHNSMLPELQEQYITEGKAQLHMYSFVRNEQDLRATMLIQCQENNESRIKFVKALLSAQEQWAYSSEFLDKLKTIAKIGGMSEEAFEKCMADTELETALLEARQWYVSQLGVESTPYFLIQDARMQGVRSADDFKNILDPLIK